MPAWGLGPWGMGPWGGVGTLCILHAWASSIRSIRVEFGAQPLEEAEATTGDVLNPRTWGIVRLDSGKPLDILRIDPVEHTPRHIYDVFTLERLPEHLVSLNISCPGLLSPTSLPVGVPSAWVVDGVATQSYVATAVRRYSTVDVKNVQVLSGDEQIGGILQIGADGDYKTESGAALLRKLIIRRLTTSPGDFAHLPEYGVGLREKEPLPVADLVKLQAEIKRQVLLEPDVDDATVKVELFDVNALRVVVRAVQRVTGQVVTVPLTLPATSAL